MDMMERKQREWFSRFGAKMRAERASCVDEPLPTAIVAKLQSLKEIEQRQRVDGKWLSGSSPQNKE